MTYTAVEQEAILLKAVWDKIDDVVSSEILHGFAPSEEPVLDRAS